MVNAGNKTAGFDQRHEAFKLGSHRGFSLVHRHLIEMSHHEKMWKLLAEFHPVDAGLTLKGQDTSNPEFL